MPTSKRHAEQVHRYAEQVSGGTADPAVACRAESLSKVYGRRDTAVHALRDVSLDIPAQTFTAVMGPSGSGKSTLLHCLAALDTPTSGRVLLGRTDLSSLNRRQQARIRRDRIGFVFQAFNLVPTLDAMENITLPQLLAGRRVDDEWLSYIVERIGLTDRLQHRPSQLSGGQQQRVALARALAGRPDVIFADEPTGNLDTAASHEIMLLLRGAVDDFGQTVVTVTHDPSIAGYADQALFFSDGRVADRMLSPDVGSVMAHVQSADMSQAMGNGTRALAATPMEGDEQMRYRRRRRGDDDPGRPMVGSDDEIEVARQERWLRRVREEFDDDGTQRGGEAIDVPVQSAAAPVRDVPEPLALTAYRHADPRADRAQPTARRNGVHMDSDWLPVERGGGNPVERGGGNRSGDDTANVPVPESDDRHRAKDEWAHDGGRGARFDQVWADERDWAASRSGDERWSQPDSSANRWTQADTADHGPTFDEPHGPDHRWSHDESRRRVADDRSWSEREQRHESSATSRPRRDEWERSEPEPPRPSWSEPEPRRQALPEHVRRQSTEDNEQPAWSTDAADTRRDRRAEQHSWPAQDADHRQDWSPTRARPTPNDRGYQRYEWPNGREGRLPRNGTNGTNGAASRNGVDHREHEEPPRHDDYGWGPPPSEVTTPPPLTGADDDPLQALQSLHAQLDRLGGPGQRVERRPHRRDPGSDDRQRR